jgi:ParB family chromosome partitioning protein
MSHRRKQALGRGLGALLGSGNKPHSATANPTLAFADPVTHTAEEAPAAPAAILELPIVDIEPNPRQPRSVFDPVKLQELSDSIKSHGVLQPLLVSPNRRGEGFTLLAGERRLRAAEMAGLEMVPVRVMEITDAEQVELAIIENVQRDDLNPVEEARGYQALVDSFHYTQEQIATSVGKSRVAIANSLRLLKLTDHSLRSLSAGEISAGHARAILMLAHATQQEVLRKEIIEKGLSVRESEDRARQILDGRPAPAPKSAKQVASKVKEDLDVHALEEKLTLRLGCKVRIRTRGKGTSGSLEVIWPSLDDLDRVLDLLQVNADTD